MHAPTSIPVLLTKVTLPHRSKNLLTRPRLVDALEEALDRKLTLVVAPAGYGKTSLLIDLAHRHEFPFCWFSQDQTDDDLPGFLAHFIACIEQRFSAFGAQSRAALHAFGQGELSLEHCQAAIVNELYATIVEHFVIVLDDYHLVSHNQDINRFINRFAQDVDQNCHLVILSRALLALPDLPLMIARGQASGIGLQDLAFRPGEIKSLMLQNYQQVISESVAQELARRTDGWITGLLLSAQTMWQGLLQQLRAQRASGMELYDYLANQVLDQQPAGRRDFLLRTAYLDEFNTELCQELLGPPPAGSTWQAMLEQIVAQNLFVLLVERDGFWLRYHHLFRDFLQERLRLENPAQVSHIHHALIDIYSRRQEWQKAYAICTHLGDIEITGEFLERAGEPMVRSGRVALLRTWLEALPAGFIEARPTLLDKLGIVLATQGDTRRGLRLLDQAVAHYRQDQRQRSLAGALAWRALVHFLQSNWQQAANDAQEVLRLTQAAGGDGALKRFRAEAYRVLGQQDRQMGHPQQAIQQLRQALVLYQEQGDVRGANQILLNLGAAHYDAGDFSSARTCYQQSLEYYQAHGDRFLEAAVLNDLAVLCHIDGEYPQAFATFEQALEAARRGSNARIESMALIGLGDLFIDLDAPEAALQAYAQARQRVERSQDLFLDVYQQLAEAAALRLQGHYAQARRLLEAVRHSPEAGASNYTHGLWLLESGQLALAEKHNPDARQQLAQATQLFEAGSQRILAGRANLLLAGALFALGDLPGAGEHLEKAFRNAQDLESQHVLVCAARQVKALLASPELSPANLRPARRLLERIHAFEANLLPLRRSLRFQEMEIPFSPPALSIQALGAARVLLDGKPVTGADWQTLATRDLLYLILSQPHGWNKEVLGEILWPGSSPAQLKNRFKNAIYRLRRAVSQEVVLFDGERYSFNRHLDYSYDVECFEALLARSRTVTDRQERKHIYAEIVRLYQGDYLPEINGSWVAAPREHLRQAYLEASLKLAQMHLDDSQPGQALEVCQRLIVADPCLEKAFCLGMQALAAIGDRTGVVRLYEKLQDSLETEMGLSPSAQTSALFRSLTR